MVSAAFSNIRINEVTPNSPPRRLWKIWQEHASTSKFQTRRILPGRSVPFSHASPEAVCRQNLPWRIIKETRRLKTFKGARGKLRWKTWTRLGEHSLKAIQRGIRRFISWAKKLRSITSSLTSLSNYMLSWIRPKRRKVILTPIKIQLLCLTF